ncbi:SPI-2 type III secretion system apparatus protein SsaS [Salmonella enterica subsp. enterica serovar Heidelberg str. SARA 39]|uniref:SPI-2 type III secretion system apparatus protein SsaS n=1 Tax=Salmonella enterica subsp. enterica serovar Heidelberg TaxID=611 RepID=A0A4U1V1C6_SALET|nr:SPI-2 type III secretion system apparatus protein SsaS [Salmonella enterica]ECD1784737.1 SPI-2 type III secretion system apparatus protein SsaS [Salmonella enterica subsp. enterica serovar Ramatgan]ECS5854078.1 SPI-2 type III secretion system apparatus protein SsaS [Salmonella enterica subsp. enterica serovar Enteritidis]ECS6623664.1 SPI-2 type III secretion system apparatus protein SsaS [Salmonella enterica subsp. enterica serovar Typhimurium]EDT2832577.1 SPI-2 type III secretion system app
MNDSELTQFVTQLLWIVLFTSMPVVLVASVVGVIVSLVQALTQIQDQTLQFMIKLLAIAITLMVSYPWLSGILLNYTQQIMLRIGEHG